MKPHKHAELIKAWADGAVIQVKYDHAGWVDWSITSSPEWHDYQEYRIKPEPQPKLIKYVITQAIEKGICRWDISEPAYANLKLVFNYESGVLEEAEVLK
jgi:hypothetical protein